MAASVLVVEGWVGPDASSVIAAEVAAEGMTSCSVDELACGLIVVDGIASNLRRPRDHSGVAVELEVVAADVAVVRVVQTGSHCQMIYHFVVGNRCCYVRKQVRYFQQFCSSQLEQRRWTEFLGPKGALTEMSGKLGSEQYWTRSTRFVPHQLTLRK